MAKLIDGPKQMEAAGTMPKTIEEFVGRARSGDTDVSIARVESESGMLDVCAGQAVIAPGWQWVRYSSPEPGGAEYVAVCVPAYSYETVHREA